jgi:glycosyltransferase involved in cell wall biosynthesis
MPETTPLRVLHICSSLARGGRERQLALIIAFEESQRTTSSIVYFNAQSGGNDYIAEYNLQERTHRIESRGFFKRALALSSLIAREKPHIVWSWGVFETVIARAALIGRGTPLVVGSIRQARYQWKVYDILNYALASTAKWPLSNSKDALRSFGRNSGFLLYNGIEERFSARLDPVDRDRKRYELLGVGPQTVVMLTCANFRPEKDYLTAFRAIATLQEQNFDMRYIVVGDGPDRNLIERWIQELHLGKVVRLIGRNNHPLEYYQLADIYLQTSESEGVSNSILEAMMQGLPIVATSVGGTPEIVDNANGLLFRFRDVNALTDHLTLLLREHQLRIVLGEGSRKAGTRFSISSMIENYHQVVETVLGRRKRSDSPWTNTLIDRR